MIMVRNTITPSVTPTAMVIILGPDICSSSIFAADGGTDDVCGILAGTFNALCICMCMYIINHTVYRG